MTQAGERQGGYPNGMKKIIALLLLLAVVPARAEDWGALFGVDANDVPGLIAQAEAQREREAAERAARRARNLSWGLVVERKHDEGCTLAAVARKMGVTLSPAIPAPEVIYESLSEGWEFQSAFTQEHGIKVKIPSFTNSYFPKANKIFIADGRFSNLRTSVDAAVAGEMGRFIAVKYKGESAAAKLDAAASTTSSWFGREFEKKPVCGAS